MSNLNLWQSESERLNLQSVAWQCGPPDSMDMPNLFRSQAKAMKEQHPQWFVDAGDPERPETRVAKGRLIGSLLKVALGKR